jgi:uncharacterized protein GlcG (DUF336 family)
MLSLATANAIIDASLRAAAERGVRPLTVVVLDASGDLVAAARQDGASMFRFDIAIGKAWGAVAFGMSSRALARRAAENPHFFGALATTSKGRMLPQPGAALIRDAEGTLLGAVGASGDTGDQDEACCALGIERAGLIADVAP